MSLNTPALIANGTIRTCRFVKIDTTKDFAVIEADAGDFVFGISQEGTHDAPGVVGANANAAEAGDPIKVFGLGDVCLLTAGAAITRGALLASDADGQGVTAAAGSKYGAIALESAAALGEKIRVQVVLGELEL